MGKPAPVADGNQEDCGDRTPTLGSRTWARLALQQLVDLSFQSSALLVATASERARDGMTTSRVAGAWNDDGLFVERVEDVVDQPGGHAWGLGVDQLDESATAGFAQSGGASVAFQQPGREHRSFAGVWTVSNFTVTFSRRRPAVSARCWQGLVAGLPA